MATSHVIRKNNISTKHKSKTAQKYLFVWSILAYPTILFLVFYVYVNINSFVMAFTSIDLSGASTYVGLENFKEVFSQLFDSDNLVLRTAIINSILMFAINLVICVPLYIMFAYYLFKKFLFSNFIRCVVMVPMIVSTFIISMVFIKFVEGPLPQILKLIGIENPPAFFKDADYSFGTTLFYMIWISFSTSLIVYTNAMNGIDKGILESSKIDGVGQFGELVYIVLPLIYPTISTFLITGVAGIFVNAGPLVAFYMYSAPTEVTNLGYYIIAEVLKDTNSAIKYPFLAAIGLIVTAVSVPLTFTVKYLLEKFGPEAEV